MSAGICIMNKNAIAMAADSAVTIGDHAAIHNSANKLFSLSRVAPVGVIVYANAALMNVPIEIIIKQYKKYLGDKTFSQLKDYVDDFIKYLEERSNFFKFDINEQNYVQQLFISFIQGLIGDYNKNIKKLQSKTGKKLIKKELKEVAKSTVDMTIDFIDNYVKRVDYSFDKYVEKNYYNLFVDIIKKQSVLQWLTDRQVRKICKKACELYNTDFDRNCFVGIAIAGFGEDEIYPHLIHLHIGGIINTKLKYNIRENVEISDNVSASIVPLAQTDVMQTFLFGINDQFFNDLAQEIPKQLDESFNAIDDNCFAQGKKNIVRSNLNSIKDSIILHMSETARNNYMLPIIQSVATLPIEELALLAESMINITSLRRKVAIDRNIGTVGGPIDVSIISKGDGFIWLKRKHYFDRKYNPQYFYSHFDKYKEGDNYD